MNKIVFLIFLLFCVGCCDESMNEDKKQEERREAIKQEVLRQMQLNTEAKLLLTSPRKLRKMRVSDVEVTTRKISFAHFIFVGKASDETRKFESYDVIFAWERNPNEYIVTRLPMDKIKFQLHSEKMEPEIQFEFKPGWWDWSWSECKSEINECIGDHLIWATIILSESDWPREVNLPLNFKKSGGQDNEKSR
jgi:hypothetical protein